MAEIPRLAPVLLVSLAIFFLLIVPVLARAGTQTDRSEIEHEILGYLNDTPDGGRRYALLTLSGSEDLERTRQLVQEGRYQAVMLGEMEIYDDTASVDVRLEREDGTADRLTVTCQRDSSGWRIWTADLAPSP
jgi:hypothetical protein